MDRHVVPSSLVWRMTEAPDLSVADLTGLFARQELTPSEAYRAVRARMDRWEPTIRAVWHRNDAAAERDARDSSERWRAGRPLSRLDGVPVTIKENIATAGVATPLGTAAIELLPASHDAPAAARLHEAGAVIIAKTTMPDFGMLSSGVSSLHPTTRSPWNPSWNPGGSSAGAAAAAAAGYGPIHIGTDIGGSIRLPANWTGVVGFKPSFGRIPVLPPYYGRVLGPLTRRVVDTAAALEILSRPDRRDHMSLPPQPLDWHDLSDAAAGARVGVVLDAGAGMPVESAVASTVEAAATTLEQAGLHIVPVGPLITDEMLSGLDQFWRMRSLQDWHALPATRRDRVLPYIRSWMEPAANLTGAEVFHGFSQMDAMSASVRDVMDDLDFLLCPVAPVATFSAELPSPSGDPRRAMEHIGFTVPFSMSGHPAISIPWTVRPDGRPVGVQIVGRRFADIDVLRLAGKCELLRPPLPPWPEAPDMARTSGMNVDVA